MSSRFVFLALFSVVHEVLLFHRDLFTFLLLYSAHLRMQCFVILSQFPESHTIHLLAVCSFLSDILANISLHGYYVHIAKHLYEFENGICIYMVACTKYQPLCTRSCCTVAEIAKLKSKNVSV